MDNEFNLKFIKFKGQEYLSLQDLIHYLKKKAEMLPKGSHAKETILILIRRLSVS